VIEYAPNHGPTGSRWVTRERAAKAYGGLHLQMKLVNLRARQ